MVRVDPYWTREYLELAGLTLIRPISVYAIRIPVNLGQVRVQVVGLVTIC